MNATSIDHGVSAVRTPPPQGARSPAGRSLPLHPDIRTEMIARVHTLHHDTGTNTAGADTDDLRFLLDVVAVHGWPGRRLIGQDGAVSALILASRAPLPYRAGWIAKITNATRNGDLPHELTHPWIRRVHADQGILDESTLDEPSDRHSEASLERGRSGTGLHVESGKS